MQTIIRRFTRRAVQYEHRDGTADLAMGVWFLAFALNMRLSQGAVPMWRSAATFYGIFFAVWATVHFGTRYIRRRLVYSRSGYAEMRKRPWKMALLGAVLAAAIAALSAWYLVRTQSFAMSAPLGMGLLISTVSTTQTQALQLSFFVMLPTIILSGFMFPREAMPTVVYWLGFALPLTYFLQVIRGIVLKGSELGDLWSQVVPLAIFGVLVFGVSAARFRKSLG
jgi:ABC-type multidrug transport system permease subunit